MQGVFSDLYVVKGVEIGHENVSVHFLEPQFKHLADKIVLTVAEAMSLEPPSPVLVLIGAAFRYTLKVIRGNILQGFFLVHFLLHLAAKFLFGSLSSLMTLPETIMAI